MIKNKTCGSTALDCITWAARYLEEYLVENPRRNAEEIFSFITKKNRLQIYLEKEEMIDRETLQKFINLIKKRAEERYPLQYITKNVNFFSLNFMVLPGVFIPRPETEIIVEEVIEVVKRLNGQTVKMLDIGTGSGCIAIALAKNLANVFITATDVSTKALEVARMNTLFNGVSHKIEFIQSNLFDNLPNTMYKIIVSNPPYIMSSELKKLEPELNYEPRIALHGGKDGLFFIERIIKEAPRYLADGGWLFLEIGFGQKEKISKLFAKSFFREIQFVKDYQDIERVVILKK